MGVAQSRGVLGAGHDQLVGPTEAVAEARPGDFVNGGSTADERLVSPCRFDFVVFPVANCSTFAPPW
eukprot:11157845-Lingulodinium_polyedra.AAC.1